ISSSTIADSRTPSAAVGSSMITIRVPHAIARATATACRWPPERLSTGCSTDWIPIFRWRISSSARRAIAFLSRKPNHESGAGRSFSRPRKRFDAASTWPTRFWTSRASRRSGAPLGAVIGRSYDSLPDAHNAAATCTIGPMTEGPGKGREAVGVAAAAIGSLGRSASDALTKALGGAERTRVIVLLASVLALSSADASTVGASATPLRHALHITNTDIGLLVTVTSLVAAIASLPFGVLADRVRRTWILGAAIVLWGAA